MAQRSTKSSKAKTHVLMGVVFGLLIGSVVAVSGIAAQAYARQNATPQPYYQPTPYSLPPAATAPVYYSTPSTYPQTTGASPVVAPSAVPVNVDPAAPEAYR